MTFRFPSNFLQTVHVLRAPSSAASAEFSHCGDRFDAEPGELLFAPFNAASSGTTCGGRRLLGAHTLGCTSVGRVDEMPAGEAFAAYAQTAWARGFDLSEDQVIALVLQQSSRLIAAGSRFVRVRPGQDGPVFHAAHELDRKSPVQS